MPTGAVAGAFGRRNVNERPAGCRPPDLSVLQADKRTLSLCAEILIGRDWAAGNVSCASGRLSS
jgi:hypothetical protein